MNGICYDSIPILWFRRIDHQPSCIMHQHPLNRIARTAYTQDDASYHHHHHPSSRHRLRRPFPTWTYQKSRVLVSRELDSIRRGLLITMAPLEGLSADVRVCLSASEPCREREHGKSVSHRIRTTHLVSPCILLKAQADCKPLR